MGNYVENNLQKDEQIVLKAKITYLAIIGPAVAALIFIVIGIVLLACGKIFAVQIAFPEEVKAAGVDATIRALNELPAEAASVVPGVSLYNSMNTAFNSFGSLCIVVPVVSLTILIVRLLCTSIAVTNKRVIGKTGIIKVKSIDLHIDKVDTIKTEYSVIGRLLGYAKLSVKGSGEGEPIAFPGVINADEFKNTVNSTIEQHAEEARRAQAAEIAAAMAAGKSDNK